MTDQTQQNGIVGSVVNWFGHPFNSQGNALNWVLFLGLIIIAVWMWNHVLLIIQDKI